MRRRLRRVLCMNALALLAGAGYAALVLRCGVAVPCLFRALTGLRCPACGATRMALALLRGDVRTAFRHNPLLFLLSPALLAVVAAVQFRYISRGEVRLSPGLRRLMTTLYALFLLFGALRNLPGAPFQ